MSSEKEMVAFKKIMAYDLQRILKKHKNEKDTYTVEEIIALIDEVVESKEQIP